MGQSNLLLEEIAVREQAVSEGYKFIEIKLQNPAFDGMHGAQTLQYTSYVDHISGQRKYRIVVDGAPMFFRPIPERNGRYHTLVDTPHNRKVLKGLVADKIVEIVDKAIEAEITGTPTPTEAPTMSKEEYFAELDKVRKEKGLPPIGGPESPVVLPLEEMVNNTGEVTPPPTPTPAVSTIRKASKPPVVEVVGSPLVSITEE